MTAFLLLIQRWLEWLRMKGGEIREECLVKNRKSWEYHNKAVLVRFWYIHKRVILAQ